MLQNSTDDVRARNLARVLVCIRRSSSGICMYMYISTPNCRCNDSSIDSLFYGVWIIAETDYFVQACWRFSRLMEEYRNICGEFCQSSSSEGWVFHLGSGSCLCNKSFYKRITMLIFTEHPLCNTVYSDYKNIIQGGKEEMHCTLNLIHRYLKVYSNCKAVPLLNQVSHKSPF